MKEQHPIKIRLSLRIAFELAKHELSEEDYRDIEEGLTLMHSQAPLNAALSEIIRADICEMMMAKGYDLGFLPL
jgi:hypothetical protein